METKNTIETFYDLKLMVCSDTDDQLFVFLLSNNKRVIFPKLELKLSLSMHII